MSDTTGKVKALEVEQPVRLVRRVHLVRQAHPGPAPVPERRSGPPAREQPARERRSDPPERAQDLGRSGCTQQGMSQLQARQVLSETSSGNSYAGENGNTVFRIGDS